MNKQELINDAIENFIQTGYIEDVNDSNCIDDEFETSIIVTWNCATFLHNGEEYLIYIGTPDFVSDEEIENKIPDEFDEDYIINETFINIIKMDGKNILLVKPLNDLPENLQVQFYNKIKQLVKEYNENI